MIAFTEALTVRFFSKNYPGKRLESILVIVRRASYLARLPELVVFQPGSMNSAKDCGREAATRAWWGMHRTRTMANSTSQYGNHFAMTFRES